MEQPTYPTLPMDPFIESIGVMRALLVNASKYKTMSLVSFWTLLSDRRLYVLHERYAVGQLWDYIRKDPLLTDFVIELTREFYLRCRGLHTDYTAWLAGRLIDSVEMFVEEESSIDKDTLEQFNHGDLHSAYHGNPWFCAIQIAALTHLEEILSPDGTPLPPPADKGA